MQATRFELGREMAWDYIPRQWSWDRGRPRSLEGPVQRHRIGRWRDERPPAAPAPPAPSETARRHRRPLPRRGRWRWEVEGNGLVVVSAENRSNPPSSAPKPPAPQPKISSTGAAMAEISSGIDPPLPRLSAPALLSAVSLPHRSGGSWIQRLGRVDSAPSLLSTTNR